MRHQLHPAVGARRECQAFDRQAALAKARHVALARHLDLHRATKTLARRDPQRHLAAQLEIDAFAHRQRTRQVDTAELGPVPTLQITHHHVVALAPDAQMLPAHRVRAHLDCAFATADHHLVTQHHRPALAQHLETHHRRHHHPRPHRIRALPQRRIVRGRTQQLVERRQRLAPATTLDHQVDVLRTVLARSRRPLLELLARQEELEALHVARRLQRARFALLVARPRKRLRRLQRLADGLEITRRLDHLVTRDRAHARIARQRQQQLGATKLRLLLTIAPRRRELRGLRQELQLRSRVGLAVGAQDHHARRLFGLARRSEQLRGPREIAPELRRSCRRRLATLAEDGIEERQRRLNLTETRGNYSLPQRSPPRVAARSTPPRD